MATTNRRSRTGSSWSRGTKTTNSRTSSSKSSASTARKSSSSSSSSRAKCAPGYNSVFKNIDCKISSFRTLANQTCGTASCKRPTPATLNTFANWVNKGAIVQSASPTQIARWTKQNKQFKGCSTTTVKNALCGAFGKSTIKAVCADKTGKFLVATSPTWKGKPFCFPK